MSASEIERWMHALPEVGRGEAEELAAQVRAAGPGLAEAVRWGRLTFTAEGDWHHWVCAVAVTDHGARLVFHKGALLDDPEELLVGDGRYVRHITHERAVENADGVAALVRSAIARRKELRSPD